MNPIEFTLVAIFSLTLLGLASYFGARQFAILGTLRSRDSFGSEDHRYLSKQARRRLVCSVLMMVMAGMLLGTFFLEGNFLELSAQREADRDQAPTEEQAQTARLLVAYWIVMLCLLFAILTLAAMDVWAIARFGLRQHRQLQADHRADLARDVARFRRERNGYS